jgi:hypothetical protein
MDAKLRASPAGRSIGFWRIQFGMCGLVDMLRMLQLGDVNGPTRLPPIHLFTKFGNGCVIAVLADIARVRPSAVGSGL